MTDRPDTEALTAELREAYTLLISAEPTLIRDARTGPNKTSLYYKALLRDRVAAWLGPYRDDFDAGLAALSPSTKQELDVKALRDIILDGGLRLPGFDHWRERASSKPSDPDDIRWDCSCGYSGSPEKVQRHWAALSDTQQESGS